MGLDDSPHDPNEWPLWKCTALTAVICGLPLVTLYRSPIPALLIWIGLILVYLGFVSIYGSGHVVEGALIVAILAVLIAVLWFELVINVDTAKALGLTIRPSVLVRADRVIE